MANPNPIPPPEEHRFKPGQSGNPAGKPPGRRSLSTIIRDMLENPIDWNLIPIKDKEILQERYKEKSAWEALVSVAYSQALAGNTQAWNWLSKSGYGSQIDLTSGGKSIQVLPIGLAQEAIEEEVTVQDDAVKVDTPQEEPTQQKTDDMDDKTAASSPGDS